VSLPTDVDLKTMDYAHRGQPFVDIALSGIDTTTMDYAFQGQPFVTNPNLSAATTAIKSINDLLYASVKSVDGLAIASVKNWNGLA